MNPLALQLADSAFPSGGFAASWGLEGLVADRTVHDVETLRWFVTNQLEGRWGSADRWFITHAHRSSRGRWVELDALAEATALTPAGRAASTATGRGLLRVMVALGSVDALVVSEAIAAGEMRGHLAVVQGSTWGDLNLNETLMVAAMQLVSQLTSAAVRLGVVGHLGAQRLIAEMRPRVLDCVGAPLADEPVTSTPLADVAMAMHPNRDSRLFSC